MQLSFVCKYMCLYACTDLHASAGDLSYWHEEVDPIVFYILPLGIHAGGMQALSLIASFLNRPLWGRTTAEDSVYVQVCARQGVGPRPGERRPHINAPAKPLSLPYCSVRRGFQEDKHIGRGEGRGGCKPRL